MKKTIKTIFLIIFMWVCLSFASKASAASASISASKTTATAGDSVTVTVTINAATWNLTVSGDASDSIVGYNEDGINETTTKTYTVTKSSAGTATVSLSGDVSDGTTDETSDVSGSVTITFSEKTSSTNTNTTNTNTTSSGSSTSSSSSSSSTTTPTFTSVNKTVYTTSSCNLRASWSTSSTATSVAKGTELTLTGTSTQTINGYVWYRVTYNGATYYIASSLVTETKPEEEEEKSSNKNLASLSIDGVELSPDFDADTTQYTAEVDGDVTELKINAKAEDSNATVTVEGNENLTEGNNIIKVKVTAEDNTTRTYFITVTVGEGTTTDNALKLSSLEIDRVNFEDAFDPDIYTYELSLSEYVESLDITATPNQSDATVEIIGNSDFVAGTNTVTILLTSADGTQTATYQIQVNLPEEVVEEGSSEWGVGVYIIIGVVIAAILIAIFIFAYRYRANKMGGTIKQDEETVTNDNDIEDQEKSKKPKGRHSN